MDFVDKIVSDVEPVKPPPVETTSFKLVQAVTGLRELAAKLRDANEFAVIFISCFIYIGICNASFSDVFNHIILIDILIVCIHG